MSQGSIEALNNFILYYIVSQYEAKIKIFSLWSLENSKLPVFWHYPGKEHCNIMLIYTQYRPLILSDTRMTKLAENAFIIIIDIFLDVERSVTCTSSCDNFMFKVPSLFAHQQRT